MPDDEPLDALLRRIGTQGNADLLHTTPLMRAVKERRPDAVAALLKQGLKSDEVDSTNTTALEMALNRRDQQTAELRRPAAKAPAPPPRRTPPTFDRVRVR